MSIARQSNVVVLCNRDKNESKPPTSAEARFFESSSAILERPNDHDFRGVYACRSGKGGCGHYASSMYAMTETKKKNISKRKRKNQQKCMNDENKLWEKKDKRYNAHVYNL